MKRTWLQCDNTVREGITIPLMIVLYGVPAVLLILFVILVTLGIRLLLRKYRESRAVKGSQAEGGAVPVQREVLEPVVGWETGSEAEEKGYEEADSEESLFHNGQE